MVVPADPVANVPKGWLASKLAVSLLSFIKTKGYQPWGRIPLVCRERLARGAPAFFCFHKILKRFVIDAINF